MAHLRERGSTIVAGKCGWCGQIWPPEFVRVSDDGGRTFTRIHTGACMGHWTRNGLAWRGRAR